MIIFIKKLTGNTISLDVDFCNHYTIAEIKKMIEEKENVPVSSQRLYISGSRNRDLEDHELAEPVLKQANCRLNLGLPLQPQQTTKRPASAGSRDAKRDFQVPLSPSSSALVCPPAADGLGRPAFATSDDAAPTNGSTAVRAGCCARQPLPSEGSSSSLTSSHENHFALFSTFSTVIAGAVSGACVGAGVGLIFSGATFGSSVIAGMVIGAFLGAIIAAITYSCALHPERFTWSSDAPIAYFQKSAT